ncbi:DUF805 domain-containing protein [Escherichia sp. E4742]|uniref:DUF805 domain-containing protein n=1 Tax=Escherichia sp. E4742 TaxID=2044467 RepID=UPI0010806AC8|nr:DUF805 domain-containing protein [Escherichia sp. E4742]QCT89759.1 DUF805 domain-containing protein [Escherichia sp. E4742]TGB59741.1 DUF805 domain-containing protein [Escherichia sp. E4742]TLJ08990.1 DUF805 domain-containing protein [Escherichia sp. E4742]
MSLTFSYCFQNPLKNLTNFNGRTRRREYWFYRLGVVLFIIVPLAAVLLLGGMDKEIAKLICRIIHILLVISITVRRLHDIDRSGWWILLVLIPIIGDIALLIFMCQKGTEGENRFGKDPTTQC